METLRDQIRAILREELAHLKTATPDMVTQTVRISSSADLRQFALLILDKATLPGYAEKIRSGAIRFDLDTTSGSSLIPAQNPGMDVTAPQPHRIDKKLITEADIAAMNCAVSVLVPKSSRITPLAQDELQRKGIRVERTEGHD